MTERSHPQASAGDLVAQRLGGLAQGVGNYKADHEATLGWVDDDCLDVLERIVANFDASGYPDTGALQDGLVANGNAAAEDYPLLDRIEACEVIEA